jgi:hypothetical protein
MANGWTPERKAQQARSIRNWRPWEKSTGPQSDEGKVVSARNATKHGARSLDTLEVMRRLRAYMSTSAPGDTIKRRDDEKTGFGFDAGAT